jgi:glycosyltransferase involved in cell wall biosynthesis
MMFRDKKKHKPQVSIVVPTKNAGYYLPILLHSLTNQNYKNFEVIINDSSDTSDNTDDVLNLYGEMIDIVLLKKNEKMAQARKYGVSCARGKYIFHLDADMKLHPNVISECLKKCRKTADAVIIPEISYGEGFWSWVKIFERSFYVGDEMMESVRFMKKDVYELVGGHSEEMVFSEDKDLDLRIRHAGYKVSRIDYPVYHNEGRLTLSADLKKKMFYGDTFRNFAKRHPEHSVKQTNPFMRRSIITNWRRLLAHPVVSIGMITMKLMEGLAVFVGVILSDVKRNTKNT